MQWSIEIQLFVRCAIDGRVGKEVNIPLISLPQLQISGAGAKTADVEVGRAELFNCRVVGRGGRTGGVSAPLRMEENW